MQFQKDSGSIVTNSLWKRRQEEKKIELANLLTQQSTSVHPSRVTHWKTVSMERPKLSKLVMPKFGPSQNSRHSVPSAHLQLPPQSVGSSSSTITPAMNRKQIISQVYVQKKLIHIVLTQIAVCSKYLHYQLFTIRKFVQ